MTSVSVVIPAYDEAATLGSLISRCLEVLPVCTDSFDLTVIDDGSTDSTRRITDECTARYPGIFSCVRHFKRLGLAETIEEAYLTGHQDYVVILHGDGQYPAESLLDCVPKLADSPVVLLTRIDKHYGWYRLFFSWLYLRLCRLLFHVDLIDPGCSKCMKRSLIGEIPVASHGVFRNTERVIRAIKRGYKVAFVPVVSLPRTSGKPHGGDLRLAFGVLSDIIKLWFRFSVLRLKP